jgi:hypothetical protein
MAQGWVGAGLGGRLLAQGSILAQWWVESTSFDASILCDPNAPEGTGGTSVGNTGVTVGPDVVRTDLPERPHDDDHLTLFREKSRLMDYRRP